MYKKVEKSKENKSRAVANDVGQRKSDWRQGFGLVDTRQSAIAQLKLAELMNDAVISKKLGELTQEGYTDMRDAKVSKKNAKTTNKLTGGQNKVCQCIFRVGKIPLAPFMTANVPPRVRYRNLNNNYQHNVADFTPAMRNDILNANQLYWQNNVGARNNYQVNKGTYTTSDETSNELFTNVEINDHRPNIDHIIEYNNWGSNDTRNARVLSAHENIAGGTSRPVANDFRLVSYEAMNVNGTNYANNEILSVAQVQHLIEEAANVPGGQVPTHDAMNPIGAIGNVTNQDMNAMYYNL